MNIKLYCGDVLKLGEIEKVTVKRITQQIEHISLHKITSILSVKI